MCENASTAEEYVSNLNLNKPVTLISPGLLWHFDFIKMLDFEESGENQFQESTPFDRVTLTNFRIEEFNHNFGSLILLELQKEMNSVFL